jgi:hypothetical protein
MTELQREYDETAKITLEAARAAAGKYARPEKAASFESATARRSSRD